jgi:hypothetical protein
MTCLQTRAARRGCTFADGGNHRVLVYTALPTAADVRANFVIGHSGPNFALANRGAAQPANNSLNQPRSIIAQNNKLAIADQGNNRILFFDLPINADDPVATHVLGQTDFISGGARVLRKRPSISSKGLFSTTATFGRPTAPITA